MGSVPMPTCALKATEKLAELRETVGDDRRGDLVHGEAAVFFGDVDGHEAEFAGLAEESASDGEVLGFDVCGGRDDFVSGKLVGGVGDLALLVGEVFRSEDVCGAQVVKEEAASADFGSGCWGCDGGHVRTPVKLVSEVNERGRMHRAN